MASRVGLGLAILLIGVAFAALVARRSAEPPGESIAEPAAPRTEARAPVAPVEPSAPPPAAPREPDAEPSAAPEVGQPAGTPAPSQISERLESDVLADSLSWRAHAARGGDEEAREIILTALEHPVPRVRERAVRAVGSLRDPANVPRLAPLVRDPEVDVREELAEALGKLPSPQTNDLLEELLFDEDEDVVVDALRSIARLGHTGAAPRIREVLEADDLDLVAKAGRTLRVLGDDEGAERALDRVSGGLDSADPNERRKARDRIRTIGGPVERG